MDSALKADWKAFRCSDKGDWCAACGQSRTPGRQFCGICTGHIDGAVLRICREMLIRSNRKANIPKSKRDAEEAAAPKSKDRELAISELADKFPIRFAQRFGRNARQLRLAGAWLAHVMAFQFLATAEHGRYPLDPKLIYDHPTFPALRDTVYEAIYDAATYVESEDDDDLPLVVKKLTSVFSSRHDNFAGMREVFYEMVKDLEKRKKLRIYRGEGMCAECGAPAPEGSSLCSECQVANQSADRLAISRGGGVAEPRPEPSPKPSDPERMHVDR